MTMTMESDVAKKLDAFRDSVTKMGEETVFRVFPSKILSLQQLIESTAKSSSPFHISNAVKHTDATVHPPPSTLNPSSSSSSSKDDVSSAVKKRKRDDGAEVTTNGSSSSANAHENAVGRANDTTGCVYPNYVAANKHMLKLHEVIKVESQELADSVDRVKLWVNLTMPKIEDGDNFGVQIQEEVLNELHRAQESAYNLRDSVRLDHLTRAKICSKMIKYPNIEDYAAALRDHDEKQHYLARQHIIDVRNLYAVLTDLIHKNITKIRAPKANNGIGLY